MKTNGKIYPITKKYWYIVLFGIAILAGIFCGLRSCAKYSSITIDAYRPRITVEQPKTK